MHKKVSVFIVSKQSRPQVVSTLSLWFRRFVRVFNVVELRFRSGLSDEQLREMEGTERRNVEARIQCLRDINLLLDAAMIQISQYMSVAPTAGR